MAYAWGRHDLCIFKLQSITLRGTVSSNVNIERLVRLACPACSQPGSGKSPITMADVNEIRRVAQVWPVNPADKSKSKRRQTKPATVKQDDGSEPRDEKHHDARIHIDEYA